MARRLSVEMRFRRALRKSRRAGGTSAEAGLSHTTIRRIWGAFGLQPHRSEAFKLSSNPLFVDKVQDVVGLYLSFRVQAFSLGLAALIWI